jgi:hypothetical protein
MGWEGREGYENDTSREFDREGEVWWAVGSFGFRGMLSWESGEIEQRRGGLCRFCNFSATTKTFSYQFTKTKRKNSLKAINCAPIVTEKTTKFKT